MSDLTVYENLSKEELNDIMDEEFINDVCFKNCDFADVDFMCCSFDGVQFVDCKFDESSFKSPMEPALIDAEFESCSFENCKFTGDIRINLDRECSFKKCDFDNADLYMIGDIPETNYGNLKEVHKGSINADCYYSFRDSSVEHLTLKAVAKEISDVTKNLESLKSVKDEHVDKIADAAKEEKLADIGIERQ